MKALLRDNFLVPLNKGSDNVIDVVSFLLYSSTDQTQSLIQNSIDHLVLLKNNGSLPDKISSLFLEPGSFENFTIMPSQYTDTLLNVLSHYLNTKIEIYYEGRGCLMRIIYVHPRKRKEKLRILRDNNIYYPLWKTEYFTHYEMCQDILNDSFELSSNVKEASLVEPEIVKPRKGMHRKSFSDLATKLAYSNVNLLCICKIEQDKMDADYLILQCGRFIESDENASDKYSNNTQDIDALPILNFLRQSQPDFQDSRICNEGGKMVSSTNSAHKEQTGNRSTGRLKFFDEQKNYGFFIMDVDNSDIFVHYDDLAKAGFNKESLKQAKYGQVLRFSFTCMNYVGKYNKSRKAVDVELIVNQQDMY